MQLDSRLKSYCLIFFIFSVRNSEALNYSFQIDQGKPQLEVTKSDSPKPVDPSPPSQTIQSDSAPDKPSLNRNPMIGPIIQLGSILKDFTKALNSKRRRRRKKKARKHQRSKKLSQTTQASGKAMARKAFLGGMSGGASMAVLGGGAAAMAGGAMMAGSAQNEETEKKISLKENELGILTIRTKVDSDMTQELFTADFKMRGLRDKAKTLLKNGEASLIQLEQQIDNILGNLQAMDIHYTREIFG